MSGPGPSFEAFGGFHQLLGIWLEHTRAEARILHEEDLALAEVLGACDGSVEEMRQIIEQHQHAAEICVVALVGDRVIRVPLSGEVRTALSRADLAPKLGDLLLAGGVAHETSSLVGDGRNAAATAPDPRLGTDADSSAAPEVLQGAAELSSTTRSDKARGGRVGVGSPGGVDFPGLVAAAEALVARAAVELGDGVDVGAALQDQPIDPGAVRADDTRKVVELTLDLFETLKEDSDQVIEALEIARRSELRLNQRLSGLAAIWSRHLKESPSELSGAMFSRPGDVQERVGFGTQAVDVHRQSSVSSSGESAHGTDGGVSA